ncbi:MULTISPECIES: O-acetyl-ADP-ribose deacetylase [unclassified Fusibacter]|uniref:O-acetyl-ADP-ribose deacetylase n=1 Tax=unclassified Fusibacter TaxID=2624464 RepID=UPI0010121D0B|nr:MULTISPECIES: O-acetyl-ADP-ribose deacetylase [unclassified Fusibacter]MCK8060743.1 O-acetyl-ADP-ribose deacetylase [Fusibacter sp. A2]NPE23039.1 O-acetyl-ADP-ribose deacetylase [Fusibacter sp. A1]RXV59808.1 O-acetyl-ADP-ribose deacetylase [Fusibacter sp. A1]
MPFKLIQSDITDLKVDAIVNAANASLLGGGGVDGAIHRAAGAGLLAECRTLGGCKTGQAKITKGYNLPAKYVIHTVGPIWQGGDKDEEGLLRSCYQSSLELAVEYKLSSIAFPLISSGIYGYPKDKAIKVAEAVIGEFLQRHELMVYLVIYNRRSFKLPEKTFTAINAFIDNRYVDEYRIFDRSEAHKVGMLYESKMIQTESVDEQASKEALRSLTDLMAELQETFSERLLRLIDLKGKTDVESYKRANVDRKLFSKIRSDKHYKPSKSTVIAFSIALELNLDETKDLLQKAGFALSRSSKFDLIIEYFINEENYDLYEINEALFAFDQPLLG